MKSRLCTILCGLILACTHSAQAEQTLLITDLLDAGEVKLQTAVEFTTLRPTVVDSGAYTKFENAQITSVGVGIGSGMQVDLSFTEVMNSQNLEPSGVMGHRGRTALGAGLSYKLPATDVPRLELLTGVGVVFESDGQLHDNGGDSTDVTPFLAASTTLLHGYRPYASYRVHLRAQRWTGTSHEFMVGMDQRLSSRVTVGCKGTLLYEPQTSQTTEAEDGSVEIHTRFTLAKNIFVVPSVAALQQSRRTVGEYKQQSVSGVKSAISLYYYFN